MVKKILKFLSGKKSVIAGLIMTISAYLGSVGTITPEQVVLIGSIVTILFGATSYATGKMVYKK